jgi:hypothetical protein
MKGQFNLNSMIGIAIGALMIWIGTELNTGGKAIASILTEQRNTAAAIIELKVDLKSAISRREYDARMTDFELRFRAIDVEIQALRVKTGGGSR